jgi:hypothetical protein
MATIDGLHLRVSWTHGICASCFRVRYPVDWMSRIVTVHDAKREQCCDCGLPTTDGIYIRDDPVQVRYPRVVGLWE